MKRFLIASLFFLIHFVSPALSVDTLPDAIVELKKASYTMYAVNKTVLHFQYRVQVINEDGAGYGIIKIYTDNDTKLRSFKALLTDSDGKKVKSLSRSDLAEISSFNDYTLYSDSKMKTAGLTHIRYPYTIAYEYEVEYSVFPGGFWSFLDGHLPSEYAQLTLSAPVEAGFSYRDNKFSGTKDSSVTGEMKTISWTATNLPAIPDEKFSPGYFDLYPGVFFIPARLDYDGSRSSLDTWQSFGKWQWSLLRNRDVLPPETIEKIQQLTIGEKDTLAKVKALYRYLQSSMRYVSIQIGTGGLQPFSASEVDKNKYGDCKALSNYMRAMLGAIGVRSTYTLIGNGDVRKIKFKDFPALAQMNHAILMVPLKSDTVWLECTSKEAPFGYIGDGNANRYALGISEDGGFILHTPVLDVGNNRQHTSAVVTLSADGAMTCSAGYLSSGILMEDLLYLKGSSKSDREKMLYERFPAKDLHVREYEIAETAEMFPKMSLKVELEEQRFASRTGSLYTFNPAYLNRFRNPLPSYTRGRTNDIYISYGYQLHDTVRIVLPDGFSAEYIPPVQNLETAFGKFRAGYLVSGNDLIYIRTFVQYAGTFGKEKYRELYDFYNAVQHADNQKIILKE